MNIQSIQAHTGNLPPDSCIYVLLRAAPDGLSAHALAIATGLDQVDVYASLVRLYDREMVRPEISYYQGQRLVASWSAMQ